MILASERVFWPARAHHVLGWHWKIRKRMFQGASWKPPQDVLPKGLMVTLQSLPQRLDWTNVVP